MKQYKIDNVTIFGKSFKKMTIQDLSKYEINPTCEFHILRHFSQVDSEYTKDLVGKEYFYFDHSKNYFSKSVISSDDIGVALKTKGTKFFYNVNRIENPKKLLRIIQQKLQEKVQNKNIGWICKGKNKTAMFSFCYDQPVGEDDLISIDNLNESAKKRIKRIPRSEHQGEKSLMINTVERVEKPETNIISVEIVDTNELPFYFITSYPSGLGPDFPSTNQTKDEFEYNQKYWDSHVFVV